MPTNPKRAFMDDSAMMKLIATRVRAGESIEVIARKYKAPYVRLRRLAKASGAKYKHKRPTPEQIQAAIAAVHDKGLTFRAAAEASKMSKSAVHRFVSRMRQKSIDSAGSVKLIDGNREFSRNKRSWVCPTHGQITVFPCVACMAEEARAAAASKRRASARD